MISCVPELDPRHQDKIRLEVLSGVATSHSLPADTVYIIKTSGSTGTGSGSRSIPIFDMMIVGRAKTVFVTNASIVPNITSISEHWRLSESDVVLLSSPPTFDPHIIDIFVTFSQGAQLLILARKLLQSSRLDIPSLTVLHSTPSLFTRLVELVDKLNCMMLFVVPRINSSPSLRILALGGERCKSDVKDRLKQLLAGGVKVYHMYGLTEMSVWQTMTRLETEEMVELMPIFVPGSNLLSDTQIDCADTETGGQIEIRSDNRKCWILDQQKSKT